MSARRFSASARATKREVRRRLMCKGTHSWLESVSPKASGYSQKSPTISVGGSVSVSRSCGTGTSRGASEAVTLRHGRPP